MSEILGNSIRTSSRALVKNHNKLRVQLTKSMLQR